MLKYSIGFYLACVVVITSIGVSMFLAIPVYAAEPETQTIIDSANALDQKIQSLSAPQNKDFVFGPTVVTNLTVNGGAVINPIDCSDVSIPADLRKATPGSNCYLINYDTP